MTLGAARVIWTINDLSTFVDEIVKGYVTMIIKAQRGPIGKAKIVSSMEDYAKVFGKKVPYTTDPLVCEMALRQGARLILIRTAHYTDVSDPTTLTAQCATVDLLDRGDAPTTAVITGKAGPYNFTQALGGRVTGSEVGPFTFGTGTADTMLIAVGAGPDMPVTLSGSMQSTQAVCDVINAGTEGLTASAIDGKLKLAANNASDDLQLKACANDAYSVLGLTENIYAAEPGTDLFVLSVNGTADQTFQLTPALGEVGAFSLTSAQLVTQLASLTNATPYSVNGALRIITNDSGPSTTLEVKATSTATVVLGLDNSVHTGTSGVAQPTARFTAADPGEWGNSLKIQVADSTLVENAFTIKVIYGLQGNLTETYSDLSMDPTSANYFVNFINERSRLVVVEDLLSTNISPANRPTLQPWGVPLAGGDNGLEGFCDADWIGTAQAQTGIYAADTMPYMSMDIMIPGTTSITVYQALIAYVEKRCDMIAYGQIPYGMTPEEAVDWRQGKAPWSHAAFSSYRFALFFGRPLVYDDMDDTRKYISCLGHLASCLAKTDNQYGQWHAPVGPKRGKVTLVEGIDFNIQGYMSTDYGDLFAETGINYLFISHLPGQEGAFFWEQRTTQTEVSSLRNLNVVRFLTLMNRSLMPILREYIYDLNHPVTWREVHRVLEPIFQDWKDRYAIYDFALQCDRDAYFDGGQLKNAKINDGLDIAQGKYHCRALIQPTEVILYLEAEIGVMSTGTAFEKYLEMKTLPGWVR